ncbi:hypothetical protein OHB05_40420 [Streptomyces sp. NBC_00638]|uniref:DUF6059 family protein n=1 Tax=unclassified Streptomyces TaxID=2593676 RepID=UPI002258D486|nr:DUF6059 family protein [Streptomyces sp. NBC_00638]MCX5008792.1 hypothetical protein [Streptomyces sp. NBC_00638]
MKRARRWAEEFARWTPGLLAVGACLWGLPVPEVSAHGGGTARTPEPGGRLPSGHPERPAAHIPPTDVERALWAALNLKA